MADKSPQDENYWKVLNSALELDVKKGHLKWTMSDLSRKSGITRSLIYYYFGRSKTSILEEAVKLIGTELVGTTPDREKLWSEGQLIESMVLARSIYERAPYISIFINEHLDRDTELGETMRSVQKKFQNKIKKHFGTEEPAMTRAVFGIYWGLLFAPFQGRETYERIPSALKLLRK